MGIRDSAEVNGRPRGLRLDSGRARQLLGWRTRWSLRECLEHTLQWHLAWKRGDDLRGVTLDQLNLYAELS